MFDIGFWELLLILVVALLVFGPERLPGMVYQVGRWVTRARLWVANARAEVEREFNTTELRQLLTAQEAEIQELRRLMLKQSSDLRAQVEQEVRGVEQLGRDAVAEAAAPVSPHSSGQNAAGVTGVESEQNLEQDLARELGEELQRPRFGAPPAVEAPAQTAPPPPSPPAMTP